MAEKKDIFAILTILSLVVALFIVRLAMSATVSSGPAFDPWADVSGTTPGVSDGVINMKDIAYEVYLFNTHGDPGTKAMLAYDSGWVNLTGQTSLNYTFTHNLNLTATGMIVDARQKTTTWDNTYGGRGRDYANSVVQTSDGGYALAGGSNSFSAGDQDSWLVKTDSDGYMQWNKTYGGTGDDDASALVQTSDGGYALAGSTTSFGAGQEDFWLVKTNASGDILWNKTYGGTGDDRAFALVQTSDGGYALAGNTYSSGAGASDFWLVKTDASGSMQWNRTYGGISDDEARSVIQTSDTGYALAGLTYSYGLGQDDSWLVKTDSDGYMQWNKTYGLGDFDWTNSVVQTSDGGYALAGGFTHYPGNPSDIWFVITDSSGNALHERGYGGTGWDEAYSVVQTSDGGYALAGCTNTTYFSAGGCDFFLWNTDADGKMQWYKMYGGTSDDRAYSVVQTSDGGYALAGDTVSFGAGGYDAYLVKTDAYGNVEGDLGLAWTAPTLNSITLIRDSTVPWGVVRVQIWKRR